MTGIYGPPWKIDGPPPEPRPYSLLTSARVIEDVDSEGVERWGNGVAVYPYPVDPPHVWDACATGSTVVKEEGGAVPLPEFGAMVVYLAVTCSSFGITGQAASNDEAQRRFSERARRAFEAVEAWAVEKEFLAGVVLGNNPHLEDGNGDFPWADVPTSVVNGFALLEDTLAADGKGGGMIHVPPGLALAADSQRIVHVDDRLGKLRTINGTIVVPGAGYADAEGPDGHADPADPTEAWAYATGPVEIRRSDVVLTPATVAEALDRATNLITYRVERYYAVDWDTVVQAAVLIDRCTTDCGAAPG